MRSTSVRLAVALTAVAFASGCVSTTLIKSYPPGARVYLDGEPVGTTPYKMSDQKIVGSSTHVRLVSEGHEPYDAIIQRNERFDVGACVGGLLVYVPFLWIMGYKPEHSYELVPLDAARTPADWETTPYAPTQYDPTSAPQQRSPARAR
jgi:hypothetical protein